MLGHATELLEAAKRGDMHRGRKVHRPDLEYPGSFHALQTARRTDSPRAGDRAPDAPIHGAAEKQTRLFEVLKGAHWTLLGNEVARSVVPPQPNMHIHLLGSECLPQTAMSSMRTITSAMHMTCRPASVR